ncbi:MAG: hypothetical protein GYB31_17750 [Bacteroidetes bacterium]|nr:hypothetical protein [Bacteroidota bacterium]
MKNANPSIDASKGKSNAFILLLIGLVGVAGLVYVLNSGSGKASLSENEVFSTPAVSMVE